MSGSSARKLKRDGVNLLAGRARVQYFYPLTALELGDDFDFKKALRYGFLPDVWAKNDPEEFLNSYLSTYIDQEVKLEGLARNTTDFARFLESASLSQGQVLNIENVASDCHVARKTVESYFQVLDDLMIASRLTVFQKKAKRELIKHKKFYFFDCGVYQTIRPRGFLDSDSEVGGSAFETLILQNIVAINSLMKLNNEVFFWRTKKHIEVDFIIYGKKTFLAIEVKNQNRLREGDLNGLHEFQKDYPTVRCLFIYTGKEKITYQNVELIPVNQFLLELPELLGN
jgi:predicted AAA+ superfamily ATPase